MVKIYKFKKLASKFLNQRLGKLFLAKNEFAILVWRIFTVARLAVGIRSRVVRFEGQQRWLCISNLSLYISLCLLHSLSFFLSHQKISLSISFQPKSLFLSLQQNLSFSLSLSIDTIFLQYFRQLCLKCRGVEMDSPATAIFEKVLWVFHWNEYEESYTVFLRYLDSVALFAKNH